MCFLQETHLRTAESLQNQKTLDGPCLSLKIPGEGQGAAIVIHKDILFETSTVISDPNGQCVIVVGNLQNTPMVLASVYALTLDDDKFFSKFFAEICNLTNYHTIIGGDFNLVQDVTLDCSSTRPQTLSKSATTLKFHAETLGLSAHLRTKFPSNKAFFFFTCA